MSAPPSAPPSAPRRVFVAGHRGMVGAALVRALERDAAARGERLHIITRDRAALDLREQAAARDFFAEERPHEVYLAAARVGGIHANATYPADFLYDNPPHAWAASTPTPPTPPTSSTTTS